MLTTHTTGAIEKNKLVYILNRDTQARLTISSPLEAHKAHAIHYDLIGVDVGFENPNFAALELNYEEDEEGPQKVCTYIRIRGDNDDGRCVWLLWLVFAASIVEKLERTARHDCSVMVSLVCVCIERWRKTRQRERERKVKVKEQKVHFLII